MTTYVARLVKSNIAKIETDAAACLFYTSCRWELVQYNNPITSAALIIHDGEFAGAWSIVKGPSKWLGHNGYTFQRMTATDTPIVVQLWEITPRDWSKRDAALLDSAISTVNACTTEPEIHTFTNSIDFAIWTSEMIAALTDAVEVKIATFKAPVVQPHKHRETVINRAIRQDHYITDGDVANSHTLRDVAIDFVQSYKGRNSFVQDLAIALHSGLWLSIGQMRGALNVMVREAKQEGLQAAQLLAKTHPTVPSPFYVDMTAARATTPDSAGAINPVQITNSELITQPTRAGQSIAPVVPNGTYTVPLNDAGAYRVIKLTDCPERYNKPAGTQIAAFQSGADNETDFIGFAFVNGDRSAIWKRFKNDSAISVALEKLLTLSRHAEFGKIWAMASGKCFICGRTLTVPISKQAGIGPICAENAGIDIHALAACNIDPIDNLAAKLVAHAQTQTGESLRDLLHATVDARQAQANIDELFPE